MPAIYHGEHSAAHLRYTEGMETPCSRPTLVTLGVALALCLPACAGTCPAPTEAASVTPRSPCLAGAEPSAGLSGDPLTLLGGIAVAYMRADLAAMRQSPLAPVVERAFAFFVRAEVDGDQVERVLDMAARTDVVAVGLTSNNGFVLVAQGRFNQADLALLEPDGHEPRRQHLIHLRHNGAGAVVEGRYFVAAERVGVHSVLDRIDGLEDPAPQTAPLLAAADAVGAYRSYFAMLGVPDAEIQRELQRESETRAIQGDLRWAALSVSQGGAGLEVVGRVHTITEQAASTIRDLSEGVRQQAVSELTREAPAIGAAAEALVFTVEDTDAVLRWSPSDAEARGFIDAFATIFEEHAVRRQSYGGVDSTTSVTAAPMP